MINRLIRKAYIFGMRRRGYSPFMAMSVLDAVRQDMKYRNIIGWGKLLRAYKSGFSGMFYYKLKRANIPLVHCLPDFHYRRLHPINRPFSHWIDDKLTLRYLLSNFASYLPEHYVYLQRKRLARLADYPPDLECDEPGLLRLLRQKRELAFKMNAGTLSEGFFKVCDCNGAVCINDKPISESGFLDFVHSLNDYLVTEFVHAHPFLKAINPQSANIARLIILNIDGCSPEPLAAYLRIGQKSTGYTELTMEGGLFCGIDLKTGRLFSPKVFKGPIVEDVVVHPDTHVPIEGELPRWGVMLESIQEMCRHVPTLRYLGFDIIITESSFKVIEINSLSGISYIQLFYPFLANPLGRQFFQALGAKN